jgi:hypothetical protein
MESTIDQLENLVNKAGDLVETKVELWKLKAAGKVAEAVTSVISKIAMVVLMGVALIILSLGVAYWIGSELHNIYYGFFIVGGFYVLAGLLILAFRNVLIKKPLSNIIIDRLIKDDVEKENLQQA